MQYIVKYLKLSLQNERCKLCKFEQNMNYTTIKQLGQTTKICSNPASYLASKSGQSWIRMNMKMGEGRI